MDGLNHINIYSKAETQLGRFLSNFTEWHIYVPQLGNFYSIEGLWYYLKASEDSDREPLHLMHGAEAKSYGRKLPAGEFRSDFKDIICSAIEQKIRSSPYFEEFKASTLPFEHYYVTAEGKKIKTKQENMWVIEFISNLRNNLKQGTLLDLIK